MSSVRTFTEDERREIALRMAVQATGTAHTTSSEVVNIAEQFYAFLTGPGEDEESGTVELP